MIKITVDKNSEFVWIGLLLSYCTEMCPKIVLKKLKQFNINLEQDIYFEKNDNFEEDISMDKIEEILDV